MFQKFAAILAIILLPNLASAEAVRTYCQISKGNGAIANQIFFEVDAAKGTARVVDGLILHFEGKPIPAEISENTAKKLTLRWRMVMKNSRGQITKMSYRAAILKGNNRIVMHAQPHGYSNNFTARGRCQRTQNPLPSAG